MAALANKELRGKLRVELYNDATLVTATHPLDRKDATSQDHGTPQFEITTTVPHNAEDVRVHGRGVVSVVRAAVKPIADTLLQVGNDELYTYRGRLLGARAGPAPYTAFIGALADSPTEPKTLWHVHGPTMLLSQPLKREVEASLRMEGGGDAPQHYEVRYRLPSSPWNFGYVLDVMKVSFSPLDNHRATVRLRLDLYLTELLASASAADTERTILVSELAVVNRALHPHRERHAMERTSRDSAPRQALMEQETPRSIASAAWKLGEVRVTPGMNIQHQVMSEHIFLEFHVVYYAGRGTEARMLLLLREDNKTVHALLAGLEPGLAEVKTKNGEVVAADLAFPPAQPIMELGMHRSIRLRTKKLLYNPHEQWYDMEVQVTNGAQTTVDLEVWVTGAREVMIAEAMERKGGVDMEIVNGPVLTPTSDRDLYAGSLIRIPYNANPGTHSLLYRYWKQ